MSRRRSTRQQGTGPGRPFARTDRIGELVRELVAGELERIADERLELVTITSVDVDGDLARARVYYSAMMANEEGRAEEVSEALDELRWPLQQVVNRNVRARKTPQISFERDISIEAGMRIEEVLAGLKATEDASADSGDAQSETPEQGGTEAGVDVDPEAAADEEE